MTTYQNGIIPPSRKKRNSGFCLICNPKTIRVTVTGKAGVPTAEVSQSPQALILSVAAPLVPPAPPPPAPTPPPATPTPTAPPPPAPEPQAEEKPVELTLTAEEEAGNYNVPDATTATITDTPIRDIPQSIQVVPRQVLEDQQVGASQFCKSQFEKCPVDLLQINGIKQPERVHSCAKQQSNYI